MTLIELMVAMLLGVLIVGGMATLFVQNKNSYRQDERIARMQEDARYALNTIVDDIALAGFWSNLHDPTSITVDPDTTLGQDCGDGTANWMYQLNQSVSSYDRPSAGTGPTATFGCIDAAEYLANTDAILVKRVEGINVEAKDAALGFNVLDNGTVYLQTNGVLGLLYQQPDATPAVAIAGTVENWRYSPALYYVRNYAETAGDGIPTLCRYRMDYSTATPGMAEDCVAQGVENLQLEYGIDTDNNAIADRYLSAPTAAQLANQLVSVRVHLLFRTLTEDQAYTNIKTYRIGNTTYDPPDDGYYRRVFTTTILLRNTRNLLCMQIGC